MYSRLQEEPAVPCEPCLCKSRHLPEVPSVRGRSQVGWGRWQWQAASKQRSGRQWQSPKIAGGEAKLPSLELVRALGLSQQY